MKRCISSVGFVVAVSLVLVVTLGAQQETKPKAHPIFAGLEVDDRIEVKRLEGGFQIRNSPGSQRIVTLGPDYLVYMDSGSTYSIYINQIREVVLRP